MSTGQETGRKQNYINNNIMKYNELDEEIVEIFEYEFDRFKEKVNDLIEDGYDKEAMAEYLEMKAQEMRDSIDFDKMIQGRIEALDEIPELD